jgi:hypothetical protein
MNRRCGMSDIVLEKSYSLAKAFNSQIHLKNDAGATLSS